MCHSFLVYILTIFSSFQLYTGFYCGRVAPHLKGASDLFKMMGYEQLDAARLVLKRASSPENLLYVACECYIAAMESMLMMRILERVEVVNYVLSDVYRSRRECRGDVDMAVLWITDNCEPSRTSPPRQRDPVEKAERERQEKENRRYAEVGYRRERDRRWEQLDDRLSPVHAYGFGYQNRNLALGHTTYDSMGRPVRGLTDATSLIAHSANPRKDTIDSGVISMEVPACAGRIGRLNNSNNVYDGIRYASDDGDEADGSLHLPESASDYDLYAAGTIDDHLQRSLLYIQRMETGPKSLKETQPACPSLKDDWGDVRENLRSKYGDKYFEGERGDILKASPGKELCDQLDNGGQPPPYKAVVEPQTKQRYDNVLQEISGKITSRRVPTPSPPNSTPRRSPPAYQSPPLTHRSPPPQYASPPQSGKPSPPPSNRPSPGLASSVGLESSRRMPSILENTRPQQQQQQRPPVPAAAADCEESNFPPPPSDLQPCLPLGSLEEEEEEEGVEDDEHDMPPPPPESLDGVHVHDDEARARLEGDAAATTKGSTSPLVNLGLGCCRKEPDFDDARFNKPRFQSFGMEDGEFLLKRDRGPSPPPRLIRNGKPNGPYRPERRSFYENVDNDSNMSSPLGTSSTFSSSADTVVAAAERLTPRPSPLDELDAANNTNSSSNESSPNIIRRKKSAELDNEFYLDDTPTNSINSRRLNIKSQSYEEQHNKTSELLVDEHERPKSVGCGSEDKPDKWQCGTCTFKNAASLSVCEICGRSRDLGPDLEPVIGEGPQCLYCTLVNAKGSKLCDACGADLEGCATYI